MSKVDYLTKSLCPECLRIIDARVYEEDGRVMISKTCPDHGDFEDVYWGDSRMFNRAMKYAHDGHGIETPTVDVFDCPFTCGLCVGHKSHTALLNIVLTNRCDLACWYCFFYAKKAGYVYEPTIDQIVDIVRNAKNMKPVGANAVQLTGGEPTLRDDLVDIIKAIKAEGIDHIQLNSNGVRLASDPDLALKLREAGVNTLYLSFDGVDPETNQKNHYDVPNVLENCRKANLGVVLVPTVIRGVNDNQLGDIIRFGFDNIDIVRGVNFQPVSITGSVPRKEREKIRITIPDAIKKIEEQTDGEIAREDFYPVPSVSPISHFVEAITGKPQYELTTHFACGMATYVFKIDGKMVPITRIVDVEGLFEYLNEKAEEIGKSRMKTIRTLKGIIDLRKFVDSSKAPFDLSRILFDILVRHDYSSLGKFHMDALFIGMMHFMDLYNYDISRVRRCEIHYGTPDGRIIPFCAFNVIPEVYRDKIQAKYGIPIEEWESRTGRKLQDDIVRVVRKKT
ncbi:tetraether lipid synthase Tes [Geoglobus acetivorans]|uniref:Radical SAM protein n=1 Tax=Geoglobus acetivorans TaxID=565033 RepID=A0ABZ3H6B1_GEOAI|nr:radical SAM protein [Geoglobus acetivorans]